MFEEIIKKEFGDKVSEVEVEDVDSGKGLDFDELKEGMIIRIHYSLNLDRQVSVTAKYRVLVDYRIELFGNPVWAVSKIEQSPVDTSAYVDDIYNSARQIAELLSNALKKTL